MDQRGKYLDDQSGRILANLATGLTISSLKTRVSGGFRGFLGFQPFCFSRFFCEGLKVWHGYGIQDKRDDGHFVSYEQVRLAEPPLRRRS